MHLKQYRESIWMSRAEMARQLGVSIVTAWRWENGYTVPIQALRDKIKLWSGGKVGARDWVKVEGGAA